MLRWMGHIKREVQIKLRGSQVGRAGVESGPRPGEDEEDGDDGEDWGEERKRKLGEGRKALYFLGYGGMSPSFQDILNE
jgi:hypothetical protein